MAAKRGESWYEPSILDRTILSDPKNGRDALVAVAELVSRNVDLGTRTLGWLLDDGEQPGQTAAAGMLRTIMERIDSISTLIPSGHVESTKVLLRTALDSDFQLQYLLEGDNGKKESHIRHATQIMRQVGCEKALENIRNGKLNMDPARPERELERIRGLLDGPLAAVKRDYELRTDKKQKPHWYSYAQGPKNFPALAAHLNRVQEYDAIYKYYSEEVHGAESLSSFRRGTDQVSFVPLRTPMNVQFLGALAATIAFGANRRIAKKFFSPERFREFLGASMLAESAKDTLHEQKLVEFRLSTPGT